MERTGYDVVPSVWPGVLAKMCADTIKKCWILEGGTGVGKTLRGQLAAWATNLGREPRLHIECIKAGKLAQQIVKAHEGTNSDIYEAYHLCTPPISRNVRFPGFDLIVDDLGSEPEKVKAYGTEIEPLREMLEERLELFPYVKTYFTTNLTEQELADRYGDRVSSRLKGSCATIKMPGRDRRRFPATR